MSRKPSPGVCGRCGRARVRPTPDDLGRALDYESQHGRATAWVNGHLFDTSTGKLIEVRCIDHEPVYEWG